MEPVHLQHVESRLLLTRTIGLRAMLSFPVFCLTSSSISSYNITSIRLLLALRLDSSKSCERGEVSPYPEQTPPRPSNVLSRTFSSSLWWWAASPPIHDYRHSSTPSVFLLLLLLLLFFSLEKTDREREKDRNCFLINSAWPLHPLLWHTKWSKGSSAVWPPYTWLFLTVSRMFSSLSMPIAFDYLVALFQTLIGSLKSIGVVALTKSQDAAQLGQLPIRWRDRFLDYRLKPVRQECLPV